MSKAVQHLDEGGDMFFEVDGVLHPLYIEDPNNSIGSLYSTTAAYAGMVHQIIEEKLMAELSLYGIETNASSMDGSSTRHFNFNDLSILGREGVDRRVEMKRDTTMITFRSSAYGTGFINLSLGKEISNRFGEGNTHDIDKEWELYTCSLLETLVRFVQDPINYEADGGGRGGGHFDFDPIDPPPGGVALQPQIRTYSPEQPSAGYRASE